MFIKKPWVNRTSIYEDLKQNGFKKGCQLPDEQIRRKKIGFAWAPGALDGVFTHHAQSADEDLKLALLLKNIATKGKLKDKVKFYKQVEKDQVASMVDSFFEKIIEIDIPKSEILEEWTSFLLMESPDRGAVKIGIALSGLIGYNNHLEAIRTLGKHEEFTLFSSVAIMNMIENPEQELWELAKHVHGWGRIELVERLANTENKEIQEWILREGYKNNIMYEYLAPIAAETGRLHLALNKEEVDYGLLLSSSEIIEALICEGPVEGISSYEHGATTIKLFVEKSLKVEKNVLFILAYGMILDYLDEIELNEFELQQGWSKELVIRLKDTLENVIKDSEWITYVESLVTTSNEIEFWKVNQAAKILKINMKEVHWERVKEEPDNQSKWFSLIESYGENIDDVLLNYAREVLPLSEMCTGAKDEMGLGIEFNQYSIISYILQALRGKDGVGKDFVLHGLNSPVINNRNMAINVIESWSPNLFDDDVLTVIKKAIKTETNEDVKKRLFNLGKIS